MGFQYNCLAAPRGAGRAFELVSQTHVNCCLTVESVVGHCREHALFRFQNLLAHALGRCFGVVTTYGVNNGQMLGRGFLGIETHIQSEIKRPL